MAEDFANWATGIALILGVAGAAWKWFFAELIRRQIDRHHPALEGSINAEVIPHTKDTCLVRVSCVWRNLSTSKIFLDTKNTHISLYDIGSNFGLGAVSLKAETTRYLYRQEPYAGSSYVFFEPGSCSESTATFIVTSGRSYGARAVVQMDEQRMGEKNIIWFRETAFYADAKPSSPDDALPITG